VLLHRLVAWLSVKSRTFEKFIKGTNVILYENDSMLKNNLKETGMSEYDLHESLRQEAKSLNLSGVDKAFLETNGKISFLLKEKQKEYE